MIIKCKFSRQSSTQFLNIYCYHFKANLFCERKYRTIPAYRPIGPITIINKLTERFFILVVHHFHCKKAIDILQYFECDICVYLILKGAVIFITMETNSLSFPSDSTFYRSINL